MAYLYAGLGIAMLTGISAMMQVANNISNFNVVSQFKSDSYKSANLSKYDRYFLDKINDASAPNSNICEYIINEIDDDRILLINSGMKMEDVNKIRPIYSDGIKKNNIKQKYTTPSMDHRLIGSCILFNSDLKHRVLINRNNSVSNSYPYSLFSCYRDAEYCSFEENK